MGDNKQIFIGPNHFSPYTFTTLIFKSDGFSAGYVGEYKCSVIGLSLQLCLCMGRRKKLPLSGHCPDHRIALLGYFVREINYTVTKRRQSRQGRPLKYTKKS